MSVLLSLLGYHISDLQTGVLLFQDLCKYCLYPIFPTPPLGPKTVFSSIVVSSSLWHRRLGHPSNRVLNLLVSKSLVGATSRLLL